VEKIHSSYAERITSQQGAIISQGNAFLRERYPELDYIKTTRIVGDDAKPDDKDKKDKDKKPEEKKQDEKKPVEKKPEPKPKLPPPPT
jgi:hypothetical protein